MDKQTPTETLGIIITDNDDIRLQASLLTKYTHFKINFKHGN